VGEIGSHSCRFGYGGDDCPKSVFPSYMYRDGTVPTTNHHLPPQPTPTPLEKTNDNTSNNFLDDVVPIYDERCHVKDNDCDPNQYLNDGIVRNWDAWENAWLKAFDDLAVRRLGKHTNGTVQVNTRRLYCESGRVIQTGKRSRDDVDGNCGKSTSSNVTNHEERTSDRKLMHPLLAIDSGHTHYLAAGDSFGTGPNFQKSIRRKQRTIMTEILFESFSAPAIFFAPTPMLASFANGRQNSLVVDIGASGMRATPVVDGLLLENAQRRSGRGGDWLGCVQRRALEEIVLSEGKQSVVDGASVVHPRYALRSDKGKVTVEYPPYSNIQQSIFHRLAVRDVMYEMTSSTHVTGVAIYREQDWTVPFIDSKNATQKMDVEGINHGADETSSDEDYESKIKKYYELPDGTRVDLHKNPIGKDLCRLPELFFSDEIPFVSQSMNGMLESEMPTLSTLPMHELTKAALTAVADADMRKELCGNIIVTGASSLFPNLEQRLSLEMSHAIPTMYKCKVIASQNTIERRYAPWIGGSILTSLGSFQQLWLSRAEYDEYSTVLALQRFP